MSKKLLSTLIASLFAAAPALAQSNDPMRVEGSATLGGIYNDQNVQDSTKLEEYQDLRNGVMSNAAVRGRNSTSWFAGYGENFGRSDQYMFLRGGMYDIFKAGAYLNDIPHNFLKSGLTPYYGPPGSVLTAPFPATNSNIWNGLNLGYDRRDWGGFFEWQRNSPWYFRADGNQVTFNGTKVGSAANGTSPGNGFVDLAIPTQYTTNNWGAEGGYQSGKATFALRWDYSQFDNSIKTLDWTNPYFGGNTLDTVVSAAGQHVQQVHGDGKLPRPAVALGDFGAVHVGRNQERLQSRPLALNTGGVYNATLPDESSFNGKNTNQSFALSWTAVPTTNVDTRVYYYWSKLTTTRTSSSTAMRRRCRSRAGSVAATSRSTGYRRRPSGTAKTNSTTTRRTMSASMCGGASSRAIGWGSAMTTTNLDQTRVDYDKSHRNRFWVEYKNTTARHGQRTSQIRVLEAGFDA